jgi:hypothetical protein
MIGLLDDNSLGKFKNLDNEWRCLDASVKLTKTFTTKVLAIQKKQDENKPKDDKNEMKWNILPTKWSRSPRELFLKLQLASSFWNLGFLKDFQTSTVMFKNLKRSTLSEIDSLKKI